MTVVDHALVLLLFVVQPVYGAFAYRRFVAKIEAGRPANRAALYRYTMLLEWALLVLLLAVWLLDARPLSALGIVVPGGSGFAAGAVLLAATVAWLVHAWRRATRADDASCAAVVDALGDLRHLMPRDLATYRWFVGLSITAGIVEEIVYRGFVFWYLAQWMPMWAVVVVSALAFGLGHSYQGAAGIVRITLVGVVFGAYYLLTGSIWLPIVAHALLDILQGATLFAYLRGPRRPGERGTEAALP